MQCIICDYLPCKFQSTLPRRERREDGKLYVKKYPISIHAPAKGATDSISEMDTMAKFQSTLPRRERQIVLMQHYRRKVFQSTLPRRERRSYAGGLSRLAYISIHAPAKGATVINCRCFQITSFQSTLPRRERL